MSGKNRALRLGKLWTILLCFFTVPGVCQNRFHRRKAQYDPPRWHGAAPDIPSSVTSVAIVNPYPWCFEVLFGIVYALQLLVPTVDVYIGHWTAYTSVSGADAFLHTFHTGLVRGYDEIALFQDDYQVMIWTDHIGMDAGDRSDPGLRAVLDRGFLGPIWVYNHEPWQLLWPLLSQSQEHIHDPDYVHCTTEVLSHPQVQFWTISPHVAATLKGFFDKLHINKTVDWALPVYPAVNLSHSEHWSIPSQKHKRGFAIQGSTQTHRRNYTGLLADVVQANELLRHSRFELQIFSWSNLDPQVVPDALLPKIKHRPLKYLDYYHEIHNSLAMLTIFPGDRYYKDTASSTVATAICAQVPLVVTRKFLEVYTFVLPGAVVVADSTSHAIALQQILDMPSKEWSELALEMGLVRNAMLQRNLQIYAAKLSTQEFW